MSEASDRLQRLSIEKALKEIQQQEKHGSGIAIQLKDEAGDIIETQPVEVFQALQLQVIATNLAQLTGMVGAWLGAQFQPGPEEEENENDPALD